MEDEQQIGSSHDHDVTIDTSNDQREQQERQNNLSLTPIKRIPKTKEMPTTTTTKKPSWQIVRDISMNILSRQTTKLHYKPGSDQ